MFYPSVLPSVGAAAVQISFYDNSKGSFELCGRLQTPRSRGVPTALATVAVDAPTDAAKERLLYGDSSGGITMLHAGEGQHCLPARQLETGAMGDAVPAGHTAQITQARVSRLHVPCSRS